MMTKMRLTVVKRGERSLTPERMEAFAEAYREMARLKSRPAAPSDGMGGITKRLDLAAETRRYAENFAKEENELRFWVGCTDLPSLRAAVWMLEAFRITCSGGYAALHHPTLVPKLLELAAREYERAYTVKT
jgi:hypothetical protein